MDAAGEHAPTPDEQGYSRALMVAAGLLTLIMPGGALIVALGMLLAVREDQRKRAQLKKWLLVTAAFCALVALTVTLRFVLRSGDPEIVPVLN